MAPWGFRFFAYVLIVAHLLACTFFLLPSLILDCVPVPPPLDENGTMIALVGQPKCSYVDDATGDKSWRTAYEIEHLVGFATETRTCSPSPVTS